MIYTPRTYLAIRFAEHADGPMVSVVEATNDLPEHGTAVHPGLPAPVDADLDELIEQMGFTRSGEWKESRVGNLIATVSRRPGRPKLAGTDADQESPRLATRVPPQVRDQLQEIADDQGQPLSVVMRQALEEYIENQPD